MSTKSKKLLFRAALAGLLVAFVIITRDTWISTLKVFAMSALVSALLIPLCVRLEKVGIKREMSALVSIVAFVLILLIFLIVFIPYIVNGSVAFFRRITPTVILYLNRINKILESVGMYGAAQTDVTQYIASLLASLTAGLAKGSAALISMMGSTVFALVISYYLITIRSVIGKNILLLIPYQYRRAFLRALSACKNAVLSYVSGTLKTSAFVGGATFMGLLLLNINDAIMLSLFMAVLEFLPYVGPALGAVPILLSALAMDEGKALLALLILIMIQQLESGIVGPHFTASSTAIHPLAAIVGVFLGGSMFGIPGILFTIPVLIVARSMIWSVRSQTIHFDS